MIFKKKVCEDRNQKSHTQKNYGEILGVSQSTISRIEAGQKVSVVTIDKCCSKVIDNKKKCVHCVLMKLRRYFTLKEISILLNKTISEVQRSSDEKSIHACVSDKKAQQMYDEIQYTLANELVKKIKEDIDKTIDIITIIDEREESHFFKMVLEEIKLKLEKKIKEIKKPFVKFFKQGQYLGSQYFQCEKASGEPSTTIEYPVLVYGEKISLKFKSKSITNKIEIHLKPDKNQILNSCNLRISYNCEQSESILLGRDIIRSRFWEIDYKLFEEIKSIEMDVYAS